MQDGLKTRPFFALFIFILKHAEDDDTMENSATAVQIVRDTWVHGAEDQSYHHLQDGSMGLPPPYSPRNDEG